MGGRRIPFLKLTKIAVGALAISSLAVLAGRAQEAARPLTAMPYSPSLDVNSIDKSVDPCVDFYKFSCGGWQKSNPIPADQATWDVYAKLANDNSQFLWGILAEDAKPSAARTPVQQKVGDYFAACMATDAIDKSGDDPVRSAIARAQSLRTREDVIAEMIRLHKGSLGTFFFNAGTTQDAADSSVMIAEIGGGGLGLPDRDYYTKMDAKSVKLREQYVAYIKQLLAMVGENGEQASADAAATLRIETNLAQAQLTRVERRDPHAVYHKMTLAQLQALAPAVNWKAYLAMQGANVESLNVEQPNFVKAMNAELATEPLAALKAYLIFHEVTAAAPYLAKPYAQANFGFFGTTLRGIPTEPPRWKTCVRAVDRNLGEALGQEFVARTFTADTKAKTRLLTEQIEQAMQQEIEGLTWMSEPTKKEALRKLHAIRNKIGYPDKWRDYSSLTVKADDYFGNALRAQQFEQYREWHKLGKPVDRDEWGMTPPTVNAYFNPQMNDINFPAGVLQPPLYDPKLDDAPNYGNTGATIGHELTHAFDDEGRQFDAEGNLKDWWTPSDAKGFEERINCQRDQYAQFVVVDDIHINSKLTSGEDVADLGGTLLAYIAWKKETAGKQLTNADGFTPDQRFWIGMAQWACENARPEDLRLHAATDPHSPGFARINGVVSNIPQFQKAFSCKAGQPMVHAPSCKVW
jgi:putative endopeptidase